MKGPKKVLVYPLALSARVIRHLTSARVVIRRTLLVSMRGFHRHVKIIRTVCRNVQHSVSLIK